MSDSLNVDVRKSMNFQSNVDFSFQNDANASEITKKLQKIPACLLTGKLLFLNN